MKHPPGAPSQTDIQRKLEESARREVATAALSAATFYAVGNASDDTGDLIIVGKTHLGLATVAVRLTIIQAMGLSANVIGSLANTMQTEHNARMQAAAAPPSGATPKS